MLVNARAKVNASSLTGATPMHLAATHGSVEMWVFLLSTGKSDYLTVRDIYDRNAVECAIAHGWTVDESNSLVRPAEDSITPLATTAIVSHPYCMRHFSCPPSEVNSPSAPPENVRRLVVLLDKADGVLRCNQLNRMTHNIPKLTWVERARAATMSDVLRVHEWSYVRHVQALCDTLSADAEASNGMAHLDGDTAISHLSFAAALRGAGSVCQAVDMVMEGSVKNAFCAVRPPGHHAGPRGLVKAAPGSTSPDSHGFCLLNNISIGAAYAMNVHRDVIKRVAIVDFDVSIEN